MSTHSADNHAPADRAAPTVHAKFGQPASAGELAGRSDGSDTYLTDGVFLYRVVRSVSSGAGELVEIEDCFLLGVVRVQRADLRSRGLRVVMPSSAGG